MTTEQMKAWIDRQTYEGLLRKWRFAKAGDPFFTGEVGDYYVAAMSRTSAATPDGGVGASKRIGWDA